MSGQPVRLLCSWRLRSGLKSHFNCSGFTCCSHSGALAIVNHTPFSPKVLDTLASYHSNLKLESAVAPAGPLTCFIHGVSDGVIHRLSFCLPTLYFTSNDRVQSAGLPFHWNIHHSRPVTSCWEEPNSTTSSFLTNVRKEKERDREALRGGCYIRNVVENKLNLFGMECSSSGVNLEAMERWFCQKNAF